MPELLPLTDAELAWLKKSLGLGDFLKLDVLDDLQRQFSSLELRRYDSGETIVVEGETGDDLFVLYEGTVSVRQGKRFLIFPREVATLEPGAIFGEVGFFVQSPRSATVVSKGRAKVFRLGADDMRRILADNPRLAQSLSALAKTRLSALGESGAAS